METSTERINQSSRQCMMKRYKSLHDQFPLEESIFGSVLLEISQTDTSDQSLLYSFVSLESKEKVTFQNQSVQVSRRTEESEKGKTQKNEKAQKLSMSVSKSGTLFHTMEQIVSYLIKYMQENHKKIVGLDISQLDTIFSSREIETLGEMLWLQLDINPFICATYPKSIECSDALHESLIKQRDTQTKKIGSILSNGVADQYIKEELFVDVATVTLSKEYQVFPNFLTTLDAHAKLMPKPQFEWMLIQAKNFFDCNGKLLFLGGSVQEGGVSKMRHAMIRITNLLGIDARWHVLKTNPESSEVIKKKFFNVLQGITPNYESINEKEEAIYDEWIDMNAKLLKPSIEWSNVIVLDSYPPCGLVKHIKNINPNAKIIYRFHGYMPAKKFHDKLSPISKTWDFMWNDCQMKDCDLFVFHPVVESIPDTIPKNKIVLKGASTDPLDGLNKHLTDDQIKYYLKVLNHLLIQDGEKPIDINRPYIAQIVRFDPSKGIHDCIYSYKLFRDKLEENGFTDKSKIPQLVIAGHHPLYDPEGIPILLDTKQTLKLDVYEKYKDDIKLACVPRNDQLLNGILQGSKFMLMLSHFEGMEVKITEALNQGKPVILYDKGGMPIQVKENVNSFISHIGDTISVSKEMYSLTTDEKLYQRMKESAKKGVDSDYFSVSSVAHWTYLGTKLLKGELLNSNMDHIDTIMSKDGFLKFRSSYS